MSQESLEAHDLMESLSESIEKREEKRDQWNIRVALTTSILAVFAALSNLESEQKTSEAIMLKNSAIFYQAKASDQWSFYQAKKIKLHMSENQVHLVELLHSPKSEKVRLENLVEKYKGQVGKIKAKAISFEKDRDRMNDLSDRSLAHHHAFALSVVCFQISIVLSSMAVMLRRNSLWFVSLGLGGLGTLAFVNGFLMFFHL
ncbi:MAG: DUF4337 domain-containing protein [Nitrospirae bacterium]|nr:DUF4337 domain-containing protein [Nitrospirota bacterium]MCL5285569.1 DUF4337 domain-containing protein [Nitrospirota bacterium]